MSKKIRLVKLNYLKKAVYKALLIKEMKKHIKTVINKLSNIQKA
jgi:hypothetical protein